MFTTQGHYEHLNDGRAKRLRSWCLLVFLGGLLAIMAGIQSYAPAHAHSNQPPGPGLTPPPGATVLAATSSVTPLGKNNTPLAMTTPGVDPTSPAAQQEANFQGWERDSLRDLAEVLGWPTAVAYDGSGRLQVESDSSPDEWARAHFRAFDYSAGARAGFTAEQEDSQLAGFRVTPDTFFSYPAYEALLIDGQGKVVERHYRWLAGTWVVGVDMRGPQAATGDSTHQIAVELLSIAVWRGLPAPPSGQAPTPNPTWSLPPASTPVGQHCTADFSDVTPDYWAYHYIYKLACAGVVSGYDDGTFRPENPTTRAQLAKILILAMGWPLENPDTPSFNDVQPAHPFYRFIETAAKHHVVSGYADGTFRPDAYVTRAQVAKMLVVARGWDTAGGTSVQLRDVPVDYWAWPYIQAAVQHGMFTGYGDNNFRPAMLATRAQLAKVLVASLPANP